MFTHAPEYVKQLVDHANNQRNCAGQKNSEEHTIKISDSWLEALKAIPFVSQHKGNTIHLLKQGSAPVPHKRQRKQVDILMTPQQYAMGHEEVKQEPQGPEIDKSQFTDITPKVKR